MFIAMKDNSLYSVFQFEGYDIIFALKNSIEYSFVFFVFICCEKLPRQKIVLFCSLDSASGTSWGWRALPLGNISDVRPEWVSF